jgi:long-chain acyl-CoA synthetase
VPLMRRMDISETGLLAHLHELWQRNWPAGVSREPHYPFGEIALSEYLRAWARRQPDKPAVIFHGLELSYGELDRLSDRFAALLASLGAEPVDRIAVFLPNCPQFLVAFFGILKAGCVHVPVNPLFKEHELLYELEDSGARILLAQDRLMELVDAVRPRTALREVLVTSIAEMLPEHPTFAIPASVPRTRLECPGARDLLPALAAVTDAPPYRAPELDRVAALNYTGGTTGMPKGCVHTQRDMIYTAATGCTCGAQMTADDVILCFMPVFWIAGEDLAIVLPIFAGATCVLMARWDALAFMQAIAAHRVTVGYMLVDNAVEVLEHPEAANHDLRSLTRLRVSSFVKKLNPEYRARWRALAGATMVEAAWGMTETHTFDTFMTGMQENDKDLASQPIFVGLPMPGTEFMICDFDTGRPQSLGTDGEIVVRTPSLLKRYWNKPEATAQALRNGWLHTGDIGVLDEGGYLHFLGRRKEMLKVRGMSVFPAEIEALLGQHPAVVGSAVIGVPDAAKGETPVAAVVLKPEFAGTLSAAALEEWCRRNMATYKVPRIHLRETLPMTATGKVRKEELAKLLADAGDA